MVACVAKIALDRRQNQDSAKEQEGGHDDDRDHHAVGSDADTAHDNDAFNRRVDAPQHENEGDA